MSKKINKQNQLHDIENYNLDNIFFGEPDAYSIPGDKPINFHRIKIYTKNQDEEGNLTGTVGDLVLKFPKMFSFGLNVNKDEKSNKITGHSMSLCMWSKEGVKPEELKATELIEKLIKKCKDKVFASRKELKKPKMEMSDLKKLDKILYWKEDEDGNRVPGMGPIFTPKLLEYKESVDKNGNVKPHKIDTVFYLEDEVDEEGFAQEANILDYVTDKTTKKYCYVTPAVLIDNIFIGGTAITIQCKIYEADIANVQLGQQRLLHPSSRPSKPQRAMESSNPLPSTSVSSSSSNLKQQTVSKPSSSPPSDDEEEDDEEEEDNEL